MLGGGPFGKIGDVGIVTSLGPYASVRDVAVTTKLDDPVGSAVVDVGDGQVALWTGMSLTCINGKVAQGDAAGQLWIDVRGGYGGVEGTLWQARGWVDPARETGNLRVKADRFTFDRIRRFSRGRR